MGNTHQLCFLALNEFGNVVDSVLDDDWFLLCFWFPCGFLLRELSESHFLLRVGVWTVLVQQLEELGGRLLVQGLCELVNGWRDLQSLVQDSLLSVQSHIFRPSHEPVWSR